MTSYIAFLRGINVGGNMMLPMKDLAALCTGLGFKDVRTYINSGNVLFASALTEEKLQAQLEKALHAKMGRPVDAVLRTGAELSAILKKNPFPKAEVSQVGVLLFAKPIPKDMVKGMAVSGPEELKLAKRELYIHYPDGMGRSKLKLPTACKTGTMRNINTISKLAGMLQ